MAYIFLPRPSPPSLSSAKQGTYFRAIFTKHRGENRRLHPDAACRENRRGDEFPGRAIDRSTPMFTNPWPECVTRTPDAEAQSLSRGTIVRWKCTQGRARNGLRIPLPAWVTGNYSASDTFAARRAAWFANRVKNIQKYYKYSLRELR